MSMDLEVGMVVEGKVTGITNFGAFVDLENGKTGMVHISEVAQTYVSDIREHLKEGQTVKVKILNIGEDGKISLSIKKALPPQQRPAGGTRPYRGGNAQRPRNNSYGSGNGNNGSSTGGPNGYEWQPHRQPESASFEDMLTRFKQSSDEKMSGMKRPPETRRGNSRKNNNSPR